jgi:hypothetical protein
MAEIVANAAVAAVVPALMQHELDVAEHPVQDPPFAPQRPYAADQQGTLTKWLVEDTEGASHNELLRIMAVTNAKYANVVADAEEQPEAALKVLKELAEDILASEALECFLTCIVPEAGKATVMLVSGLSRYRPDLGTASPWTGQVFGFLGEAEGGQLPPLFKLPEAYSLRQALDPKKIVVPTWTEWNVHYGVGPDRNHMQGEELMTVEGEGAGRPVYVPRLQYVPRAWAPYFIGGMSPEKAMRLVRQLITGLGTDAQRAAGAPLERWCAAACTRSGVVGGQRTRSKVHLAWTSPAAALDRALGRWASRKLAPYTTVCVPPVVAAVIPAGVTGGGGIGLLAPGQVPLPSHEVSREKIYSPFEHERIRLACGLSPANYEPGRPSIYGAMLTEGRSMAKVEAVLQQFLAPAANDWDPIRIYVSAELARDMKDLKFGWGNENTYDTCHRGISPFAVLQVSVEQQNKRRKVQERANRATHLSTEDVRSMEADPGYCPGSYYGMLNLIKRYIRLLTVFFGPGCGHLLEVQGVYQMLADKSAVYETMTGDLIAETLWQIFIDARAFFSTTGPTLPESQLFQLRSSISMCTLRATMNCPVDRLLGRQAESATVVSQQSSVGSRGSRGSGGGGSTMSTLSGPSTGSSVTTPFVDGRRKNPKPVPEIVNIMQVFREANPNVDMQTLMRSQKLLMSDIGIGGRGQCLDFNYFGQCVKENCSYHHDAAHVSPGKRKDIVKKMTKAIAGYLAADSVA